jgi:hypothetical protein
MAKQAYVYSGTDWVPLASEVTNLSNYQLSSGTGLNKVIPTSVAVGSGSGSVNSTGTVTFSGASSVTLNNIFSSTYKSYKIITELTQSAAQDIYIRLRSGSTTATGTDYQYNYIRGFGTTLQTGSNATQDNWMLHYYSASGAGWAEIIMHNPFETAASYYTSIWRTGQPSIGLNAGIHNLTNSYESLVISPTGGTITGTISVHGYKN